MKKVKAIVSVCLIGLFGVLVAGCSILGGSSDARKGYEDFKEDRPAVAIVKSGDQSIDNVAGNVAILYGQTLQLLDDYIKSTEGNRTYVAFVNDTIEMKSEEEVQEYFNKLKPEQQQEILSVKKMEGFNNLKKASEFLKTAVELTASTADLLKQQQKKIQADPFGAIQDVLAAKETAQNMLDQAEYSVKALEFMVKQYIYVQNLKTQTGR